MTDEGWIAREQTRGSEFEQFVPGDFLVQDRKEGNPPSFIISLSSILQIYKDREEKRELIRVFLEGNIHRVERWFNWYTKYQQLEEGLFVWYYDNHKGFIGSGLDDYPRKDHLNREQLSLDLQVWMIGFAQTLQQIHQLLHHTRKATHYQHLHHLFTTNLQLKFYDNTTGLYKSVFSLMDNNNRIHHQPFIGYVNLFPLFFGLIPLH